MKSFRSPLLITFVPLLFCAEVLHAQTVSDSLYLRNRTYHLQTALHEIYATEQADVIMLGNSITQGVQWQELLGRPSTVNRGISGDVTAGFFHRMEAIYRLHPKLCFVMGGINDIFAGVPVETVFVNYTAILEGLRQHNITPVIQSTLYASSRWKNGDTKNPDVRKLNTLLQEYARTEAIEYLDLNLILAPDGVLRDDISYDGLHLNAQGYVLWRPEVERILQNHGL